MIVFPGPDGRSCLRVNINLMERFSEVHSESKPFQEEIIPDIEPQIRTDLPEEGVGGA